MKKHILTIAAILGCSLFASAQESKTDQNPSEEAMDRIQQEPPRPTEARVETAAQQAASRNKESKKQQLVDEPVAKQKADAEKPKTKSTKKARPKTAN